MTFTYPPELLPIAEEDDDAEVIILEGLVTDEEAEKIAAPIIEALLQMPERARIEVLDAVRHNGIFCHHCGFGSRERPNPNCQCWNDE